MSAASALSSATALALPGLRKELEHVDVADAGIIEDDLEGEEESFNLANSDDVADLEATISAQQAELHDSQLESLKAAALSASRGIAEETEKSYNQLINQCARFLAEIKLIKKAEDFYCSEPSEDAPLYIVVWIMDRCDTIDIWGNPKKSSESRESYSSAQKMRAAMTFAFGKIQGLGMLPWHRNESTCKWTGNPSVSQLVSSYMLSLKRRKVKAGEIPVSARAITSNLLMQLHDFNHQPANWKIKEWEPGSSKKGNLNDWGDGFVRRLLEAVYTFAFLCLLRVDEVLKIQIHDIKVVQDTDPKTGRIIKGIELTLPFRKTHQTGEIPPFHIWEMPEERQHLCAVRAFGQYLKSPAMAPMKDGHWGGYLFRRLMSGNRPDPTNLPMTSSQFLTYFRHNLVDVRTDPCTYGTHSFRRGGCQFLHLEMRWPLRRVCEWGGWSTDFSHMTIVKYLISEVDDPTTERKDFMKPYKEEVAKCWYCGRACKCGY